MIISLSVSNFRSFLAEETFSLSASNRLSGAHDDHLMPIPNSDQSVLRVGVLYGANGAGKSNLFKAIRYVKSIALNAREKGSGTGREAFRLAGRTEEPSSLDLQFIVTDRVYRFGFKADDQRITEEWLSEVVSGREKTLYERTTDVDGKVLVDAVGLTDAGGKLKALATIGGPQNQSFLATVGATLDKTDYGDELRSIIDWFRNSLVLISPNASFGPLGAYLSDNPGCADFAGHFLNAVSTGVDHLLVSKKEITEEELRSSLPEEFLSDMLSEIDESEDGTSIKFVEGNEIVVERGVPNRYYRVHVRSAHKGDSGAIVPFDLNDESDGTRRLLNLMPALHRLHNTDSIYVIDEIDRSLHPNLVWEFVNFFLRSRGENHSQIILTTHESNLLDLDLLRRDEIWFAEKDQNFASRLYALTDFNVRKDLMIRKHYLDGRFGAVPFMGDLDRLRAEIEVGV